MLSFYNPSEREIQYRQRYLSGNYTNIFNEGYEGYGCNEDNQFNRNLTRRVSQNSMRRFMLQRINKQEPHPLHYYRQSYYNEYNSPTNYWNRLLSQTPENIQKHYIHNLKQRFFNKLRYNLINSKRTRIAILNYINFKKLTREPDYLEVVQSSAGIQGWSTAGPYQLIEA